MIGHTYGIKSEVLVGFSGMSFFFMLPIEFCGTLFKTRPSLTKDHGLVEIRYQQYNLIAQVGISKTEARDLDHKTWSRSELVQFLFFLTRCNFFSFNYRILDYT